MQQRLLDIGAWLEVNGEAIYGSTSWHRPASSAMEEEGEAGTTGMEGIYYTARGDDLFLITTSWPTGNIVVDGIAGSNIEAVSMLGVSGQLEWSTRSGAISITPPAITPADLPCDHAWVIKIQGALRRNAP